MGTARTLAVVLIFIVCGTGHKNQQVALPSLTAVSLGGNANKGPAPWCKGRRDISGRHSDAASMAWCASHRTRCSPTHRAIERGRAERMRHRLGNIAKKVFHKWIPAGRAPIPTRCICSSLRLASPDSTVSHHSVPRVCAGAGEGACRWPDGFSEQHWEICCQSGF